MYEQCPHCGSKSGVDTHNRGFCHACKKDFPGRHNDLFNLVKVAEQAEDCSERHRISPRIHLPESEVNKTGHLPIRAMAWLSQYFDEHNLPECFWSWTYQRLCFPYYKDDKMIGCWMRAIDGLTPEKSGYVVKWLYAGEKNFSWILPNKSKVKDNNTIVLCEDVVSALKISQFMNVICLGGTSLHNEDKIALQKYKHVILFLDSDAAGVKAARKIQVSLDLTHPSRIIRPGKDAKCYSEEELKQLIGG